MFLLRAFKPQKYHRLAHDGYPGGPTEINIRVLKPGEKLTDAEKQPPVFSIGAAKPETEPAEPNALPTISLAASGRRGRRTVIGQRRRSIHLNMRG
jgi:hypothetical protein